MFFLSPVSIIIVVDVGFLFIQLLQLAPNVSSSNQSQFNDIQSLLCASLQSVLRRVTPADAAQLGDSVFQALVAMLQTSTTGGVQEDALMALGSLIELLGEGFMKYFSVFQPFLLTGLGARAEHYQVSCSVMSSCTIQSLRGRGAVRFNIMSNFVNSIEAY